MKTKLILFLIFLTCCRLSAQEVISGVIVGKGKPYADKISLRWNINDYQLFKQLAINGVHIDRIVLNQENKPENADWTRLTKEPIKAWALEKIRNSSFNKDTAVAVIAEGLYGKIDLPKNLDLIEKIKYQDMDRQNRFVALSLYSALSKDAAMVAGLAFEDIILPNSKKTYIYRITPVTGDYVVGKIEPGFIYVAGADLDKKHTPIKLLATSGEHAVILNWPVNLSPYSGYYIQRSEDGKNFKILNKTAFLPAADSSGTNPQYYYYDSVANYKPYYYRIQGVDSFGDKAMFTDTVKGMGIDLTPPISPEFEVKKNNNKLIFSWTPNQEPDIKGYLILKGKTIDARDSVITRNLLPSKTEKHEITLPNNFSSSYFRLLSVDTSGNSSLSNAVYIFEPDTIPPAPPIGLSGFIDTLGIVHVKWNLDKSEEAIRGYKVYIANQGDHQYIPVLDMVKDTTASFAIELYSLTKNVLVKVAAIDGSFNHSELSTALILKRPDIIPPVAPELLDFTNTKNGIKLVWSSYQSNDLLTNVLLKKQDTDQEWTEIFRSKNVFQFLDTKVSPGKSYSYSMQAIDSSGLVSKYAETLHVKTSNVNSSEKITLNGTYSSKDKNITLRWNQGKQKVQFYVLYKDLGEGLTMYKSLPEKTTTFSENGTTSPKGRYALKLKYADNSESDLFICL